MAKNLDELQGLLEMLRDFTSGDPLTKKKFVEAFGRVSELVKSNDEKTKQMIGELNKLLKDKIEEINTNNTNDRDSINAEFKKQLQQYTKDVLAIEKLAKIQYKALESLIPEAYDDADLRSEIEALRQDISSIVIPEPYDPAEILERLDDIEERLGMVGESMIKLQGAAQTPSVVHWPRHESFTMNGSDTFVTLTQAVGAAGTAIFGVRYNGQTLDIDNQYTVNGNRINLDFTPINGSTISVSYFG